MDRTRKRLRQPTAFCALWFWRWGCSPSFWERGGTAHQFSRRVFRPVPTLRCAKCAIAGRRGPGNPPPSSSHNCFLKAADPGAAETARTRPPERFAMTAPLAHLALLSALVAMPLAAFAHDHDVNHAERLLVSTNTAQKGHHHQHASNPSAEAGAPIVVGDLVIEGAWVRATPPGAPVGGAYLSITNKGDRDERLLGGAASFAGSVEIHEMEMAGGMMRMQPIEGGLVIAPGATEVLQPGGNHVMFMGLTDAIEHGDPVRATLTFENAGDVAVMFKTAPIGATSPGGHGRHHRRGGQSHHGGHNAN